MLLTSAVQMSTNERRALLKVHCGMRIRIVQVTYVVLVASTGCAVVKTDLCCIVKMTTHPPACYFCILQNSSHPCDIQVLTVYSDIVFLFV